MSIVKTLKDIYRSTDMKIDTQSWNGTTEEGNFKELKHMLKTGDDLATLHLLDNLKYHRDLSCIFNTPTPVHYKRAIRDCIDLKRYTHSNSIIAEIGPGGAATTARMFLSSNNIKCYVLCDLPIVLLVAYYNMHRYLPGKSIHYINDSKDDIIARCKDNDIILLPHYMANKLYSLNVDVYYNAYSLSEMRGYEIKEYIDIISSTGKYLLSENYLTSVNKCHICNGAYRPLQPYIPNRYNIISQEYRTKGNRTEDNLMTHYLVN